VEQWPHGKEERSLAQNGSSVEQHTERAKRKISPWIERLARFGYLAYGVVYVLVGVLALQAAFGGGGGAPGQEGALRSILLAPLGKVLLGLETLARQPFGPYLLGAVAAGLVAYGAFMFVMARYRRIEPA
jgi:Domain of Unknown Function (DUF1206)